MKSSSHEVHKQYAFESYCKSVLRHEACSLQQEQERRGQREMSLHALPEEALEQMAVMDEYPWEYTAFSVGGDVILIRNSCLAAALELLPEQDRRILLMYWCLDMTDWEIAAELHMARRTVNSHRRNAGHLLRKLLGGEDGV